MKNMFTRFWDDERGVTALETAIILIAFVVVAAVFAFTILSTGTFMTERSKEAAYSGLAQVRGSMELKGGITGYADTTTATELGGVAFTVANVAGGSPIDFTPPDGSDISECAGTVTDNAASTPTTPPSNVVNVSFRNSAEAVIINEWSVCFIGFSNNNNMLEDRELFRLWVPLNLTDTEVVTNVGPNEKFDVEVKPPSGATIVLQRSTPATIEAVMDFQ